MKETEWQRNMAPPNNGMELTGQKRHALCKEQRPRLFRRAVHARRYMP